MLQQEEALLRDIRHVGHTSSKEGVWAGVLTFLASVVFWASFDIAWLPAVAKALLSFLVAVASGFSVGWAFSAIDARRRRRLEQEIRDERAEEQLRQIEEAKRSGAFERWQI